jgi:dTDP-4-amino-4,6-dideoxygalactose transaminase
MINFGFKGYDNVIDIGINGKMTEICAAAGLVNFEKLPEFISINKQAYQAYQSGLKSIPGVSVIEFDENEKNNYQYVTIKIEEDLYGISRDRLNDILHSENIIARRYFYPGCHKSAPYFQEGQPRELKYTDELADKVLVLPTGSQVLNNDAVGEICRLIAFLHDRGIK